VASYFLLQRERGKLVCSQSNGRNEAHHPFLHPAGKQWIPSHRDGDRTTRRNISLCTGFMPFGQNCHLFTNARVRECAPYESISKDPRITISVKCFCKGRLLKTFCRLVYFHPHRNISLRSHVWSTSMNERHSQQINKQLTPEYIHHRLLFLSLVFMNPARKLL